MLFWAAVRQVKAEERASPSRPGDLGFLPASRKHPRWRGRASHGRGVRRGPDEVAQAMRRFAEPWEDSRHELRQLYDCGEIVVAAVSWHIRGRGSERELLNQEAHTWTLHVGRIALFEWGQDVAKALEAAGLKAASEAP